MMSAPTAHGHGHYTLRDVDALPDDGKGYELADGWLTELPSSPWHDHGARRLMEILRTSATSASIRVHVAGGPTDVSTPAGIRKPDVFVVPEGTARNVLSRRTRAYRASDLLLLAEVVTPRSGSKRTDRVDKVSEYAEADIPHYWIIDLDPEPKVTVFTLGNEGAYTLRAESTAGHVLGVAEPFPVAFDPRALRLTGWPEPTAPA
jgi:Uma2 family endonuclease